MSSQGKLKDKVALVTGAANGMGHAITERFVKEGAVVVAVDIRKADLEKWEGVENVIPVHADITKIEDVDRVVGIAEEKFGRLDILCNVAGINDLLYPLLDTTDEIWDKVVDLDLKAPFRLSRRAVPGMVERGYGIILNMGSGAGLRGNHGPSYTAAKAGLIGLTRHIAFGYAKKGIRCNIIHPGAMPTKLEEHSGGKYHPVGFEMLFNMLREAPIQLYGELEDVANAAVFLCSDDSKFVNGSILTVDGGWAAC